MSRKSTIVKNWPKYLLQWGVLAALIVFITGLIPSKNPVDPEAYCPMGGLQALATYLSRGSLPCSMSSVQVMMGIALVAAIVLFSKLFCAYICPVGTVQGFVTNGHTDCIPAKITQPGYTQKWKECVAKDHGETIVEHN